MAHTRGEIKNKIRGISRETELLKKAEPLKMFSLRLHRKDMEHLRTYFKTMGLNLSAGIRMALREFMERQGIH